jgi:hypothetical protein
MQVEDAGRSVEKLCIELVLPLRIARLFVQKAAESYSFVALAQCEAAGSEPLGCCISIAYANQRDVNDTSPELRGRGGHEHCGARM